MDCRESQTLLAAFHDGELPDADRIRVEEHLRGCAECGRLLADLARADEVARVPDPGPDYWDRFNARVSDRIDGEAEAPVVAVPPPKRNWMRQQLRFLVPAAAAAALVVAVVRYGGQSPVAPKPALPPAETAMERPTSDQAGRGAAEREVDSRASKKAAGKAVSGALPAEPGRTADAPAAPPADAAERFSAVDRARRDRLADRSLSEEKEEASRYRAAAPAEIHTLSPPRSTDRDATNAAPPVAAGEEKPLTALDARKKTAGAAPAAAEPQLADRAESEFGVRIGKEIARSSSPCETAQTLADRGRFAEAEAAQRECLAQDPSPPAQEKGLIFLAELLDRQARFSDADEILADVRRQFPKSRPLDLYRQQRPMIQGQQMPVPIPRENGRIPPR
jgi:hypothetical protein